MPQTSTRPTFLPLTTAASRSAARSHDDAAIRAAAEQLLRRADEADVSAADCWTALLAGCDSPVARLLPSRLTALTAAAAEYAGDTWWCSEGSRQRRRLAEAQHQLVEAIREGDGPDYAGAFVNYDQAMATTVVSVQCRMSSPA